MFHAPAASVSAAGAASGTVPASAAGAVCGTVPASGAGAPSGTLIAPGAGSSSDTGLASGDRGGLGGVLLNRSSGSERLSGFSAAYVP
ncbi:MAG: hypothetical protein LBT40_08760 [Deltaproteobacteria bacterium]|nr:hypothetical protein [Deltaproteobacteria bacterium]